MGFVLVRFGKGSVLWHDSNSMEFRQRAVRLAEDRMRVEGVSQWFAAVGVGEMWGCLLARFVGGFADATWENT